MPSSAVMFAHGSHARPGEWRTRRLPRYSEPQEGLAMHPHDHLDSVRFADVQVIRDTGSSWLLLIAGKLVAVPGRLVLAGSTVSWPRARRGSVVIPKSLAVRLRLA